MSQYDHLFKLLLVGDSNVGKTSLLLRFTTEDFKEDVKNTVGVDVKSKILRRKVDKNIKLTIWDTAGQERFRTLTSSYYRGSHGIILVYDVSSRSSFENIQEWLKEIDIYSTREDVVKLLVGNKIDLEDKRAVSFEEGREFAKLRSMLFMESSAKTERGVREAFTELIDKILDSPILISEGKKNEVDVDSYEDEAPVSCC